MASIMPILYHIDRTKGYSLALWRDLTTAEQFRAHIARMTSDPDWPPRKLVHVVDLRGGLLDPSIDAGVLKEAADAYGGHSLEVSRLKCAIVAGSTFRDALEFERYISPHGTTVIVFNTMDIACSWLGLPAAEVEGALSRMAAEGAS
jgi:hypothetical protein